MDIYITTMLLFLPLLHVPCSRHANLKGEAVFFSSIPCTLPSNTKSNILLIVLLNTHIRTDMAIIIFIRKEKILETEMNVINVSVIFDEQRKDTWNRNENGRNVCYSHSFCYLTHHHSASNHMQFSTVTIHKSHTCGAICFWIYVLSLFKLYQVATTCIITYGNVIKVCPVSVGSFLNVNSCQAYKQVNMRFENLATVKMTILLLWIVMHVDL
jgi:hypothetical protein